MITIIAVVILAATYLNIAFGAWVCLDVQYEKQDKQDKRANIVLALLWPVMLFTKVGVWIAKITEVKP